MTQTSPQHRKREPGEIVVLPRVSDVAAGPVTSGVRLGNLGIGDLANVVPFRRPRATHGIDAPPCVVDPAVRPMPHAPFARSYRFSLALAATILMHGAAFAAFFFYEPPPLASIGVEAVSVEIVVGSNSTTGVNNPQSQDVSDSEYAPKEDKTADKQKPEENLNAPEKPVEQPQTLASVEPAPQTPVEEPKAEAAPVEPQPQPKEKPAITLAPEAMPTLTEPPKQIEKKPIEIKRETPKPVVKKPEPKKPEVKREAATKKRGEAERTQVATAPEAHENHVSGRGAGAGRSDATENYRGMVRTHIQRYLQYPSDANRRGERGRALVRFWYDNSGRITSAKVMEGSGSSLIDQAAQATVQRASPIPAPPPEYRGKYFDLPLSFEIR
jgi:protein TonB